MCQTFLWLIKSGLSDSWAISAFTILILFGLVAISEHMLSTMHNSEVLFWHLVSDIFDAAGSEAKQKKGVGNLTP